MNYKIAYIPENLELTHQLNENPPTFKYHVDNFKHILGSLTFLSSVGCTTEYKGDEFVMLNSTLMQAKVHNYKDHISYMVENNILKRTPNYIVGERSYAFQFTDKYVTNWVPSVITKPSLVKDITIKSRGRIKEGYLYTNLKSFFNDKLTIDKVAYEFVELAYNKDTKVDGTIRAMDKKNRRLRAIKNIETSSYYHSKDTTGGRFHTNITGMKRELRNYLKYDGKPLVSIDLKASQPYLIAAMMNKKFYSQTRSDLITMNDLILHSMKNKSAVKAALEEIKKNSSELSNQSKHHTSHYKSTLSTTSYKALSFMLEESFEPIAAEGVTQYLNDLFSPDFYATFGEKYYSFTFYDNNK